MCQAKFVLCHTQSQGAKYATHKMPLMLKMCHTLLKKELIQSGNTKENDNLIWIPTISIAIANETLQHIHSSICNICLQNVALWTYG